MPKEIIEFSHEYVIRDGHVISNPDVGESGEERHFTEQITLNWTKGEGGAVQLGFELDLDQLKRLVASAESGEWLGELPPGRVAIYTPALGRGALQRMLKHGKRARNDVYGEDE